MNLFSLAGKVAVVTGGGSGIGLATARRFVAADDASYVTGTAHRIEVDGGWVAGPSIALIEKVVAGA